MAGHDDGHNGGRGRDEMRWLVSRAVEAAAVAAGRLILRDLIVHLIELLLG